MLQPTRISRTYCFGFGQEAFKVPLVVQLTDDEKFLFKPDLKLEEVGFVTESGDVFRVFVCVYRRGTGKGGLFESVITEYNWWWFRVCVSVCVCRGGRSPKL